MITLELTEQEAKDLALLLMFTDNECYDSIKLQLSEFITRIIS